MAKKAKDTEVKEVKKKTNSKATKTKTKKVAAKAKANDVVEVAEVKEVQEAKQVVETAIEEVEEVNKPKKKKTSKKTESVKAKKAEPKKVSKASTSKKKKVEEVKELEEISKPEKTKASKASKNKSTKTTKTKKTKKTKKDVVEAPVEELVEEKETEVTGAVKVTNEEPVVSEPVVQEEIKIPETKVEEQPKKKKHPILVALGIILAVIILFAGYVLISANNVKELEDKFDNIEVLKAAVVDPASIKNHDEGIQKALESAVKSLDIDFKTGVVTVNASKGVIYNIVDLDIINDAIKEYGVVVDKFGYSVDGVNSTVDAYASAKKWFIKVGIHAQLGYELTENEIIVKIKDVEIGNLPDFLYKSFVPKDEEIGRFNVSNVKINDEIELKVFSPNKIKEISYKENTVSMKYAISDVIDDVVGDLFAENPDGTSKVENIANDVLEGLGLSDVKFDDIVSIIEDIASLFDYFTGK